MKRTWLPRIMVGTCLVLMLALISPLVGPAADAAAKPVVLKYMGYTVESRIKGFGGFWFKDRVAERSKGELILDYKGGPEAIPMPEQFSALRAGVIDVVLTFGANHEKVVPGVFMIHLANHNPDGTRPQAVNDWINERYKPVGVRYLTQVRLYDPWHTVTKVKVTNMDDIRKLRLRCYGSGHTAFVKATGATPIAMKTVDTYEALQRGVVDGSGAGLDFHRLGWAEVVKYMVFPAYKWRSNNCLLMNLNTWNRLPDHLRDVLTEAAQAVARHQLDSDLAEAERNLKVWMDAGVERIEFTGALAEKWTSLYDATSWKRSKDTLSPELFREMQDLAASPPGCPKLPE